MIRELGDSVGSKVFGTLGRALGRTQERKPLPVDLLESDDAYLAIFDAPGAMSSDIQVKFEEGTILVQVDRFRTSRDGFQMVFPGRGLALNGRASLPDGATVESSDATATLKENGTLHVRIPKVEHDGGTDGTVAVKDDTDE